MSDLLFSPDVIWCDNSVAFVQQLSLHLVLRIQFPLLVWIAAILSSPAVNYWRKDIFVPTFNFIDVAMIFLSFVAIYMVSLQGKSNYLVGLCLVMMYMVFLLINWYE